MGRKNYSARSKIRAVGEVLAGYDSLTAVAQRYGFSKGYLSILTSCARRSLDSKEVCICNDIALSKDADIVGSLDKRISDLEVKFASIFK